MTVLGWSVAADLAFIARFAWSIRMTHKSEVPLTPLEHGVLGSILLKNIATTAAHLRALALQGLQKNVSCAVTEKDRLQILNFFLAVYSLVKRGSPLFHIKHNYLAPLSRPYPSLWGAVFHRQRNCVEDFPSNSHCRFSSHYGPRADLQKTKKKTEKKAEKGV